MDGRLFTEDAMKCAICRHGTTRDGHTTVAFERAGTTLVFRKVPAQVCRNCGEEYVSEAISETLLLHAQEEAERGVTIEMLDFAA